MSIYYTVLKMLSSRLFAKMLI